MKTTFGVSQLFNHAPRWLVPTYSAAMILLGIVIMQVQAHPTLTDPQKDLVEYYLICVQGILSGLAPFFGVSGVDHKK
jgi:hypothetical protein